MRFVILALALVACGPSAAQVAITGQAEVIQASRAARFDFYEAQHEACLERPSFDEYRECMAPARHVARAADSYRHALEGAQAAIRLGQGFDLACVVAAARELVSALEAANVPVPSEVSALASMIPEGLCRN